MLIKLVQLKKSKYFFQGFFFFPNSADMLFFSMCGGVQKSGDEKLVTLYDRNLKLASIMSFWVYHCKRNLDDKIRHWILLKTLKLCKKYFWVTQAVNNCK